MKTNIYAVITGYSGVRESDYQTNQLITDSYVDAVAKVENLRIPTMTEVDGAHYSSPNGATIVYQVREPGEYYDYILIERWSV